MKKLFKISLTLSLFYFLTFSLSYAQNLIPNGDFELGPDSSSEGWQFWLDSTCGVVNTTAGPIDWYVENASPYRMVNGDIFTCNWDSTTIAQSGQAYIGFGFTEAGRANLLSPLEKDSLYKLSYYLSLQTFQGGDTTPNLAVFKFGLSDSVVSPYVDSIAWKYFDTIFTASDTATVIRIRQGDFIAAAINIDNIYLEKLSATGIYTLHNNNRITVLPNPTTDILNIKTNDKIRSIEICDIYGKVLLRDNESPVELFGFSSGVYIVRIKTNKKLSATKIFIK